MREKHISVLREECLYYLNTAIKDFHSSKLNKMVIFDFTFGAGGHTKEILSLDPNIIVIAFDQDLEAVKNGQKKFENEINLGRLYIHHSNFKNLKTVIQSTYKDILKDVYKLGAIMDLGVSSMQLDDGHRGMSFRYDAPLDMRMDQSNDKLSTAEDIVNNLEQAKLSELLYNYGEEQLAESIAREIVKIRASERISRTKQLAKIIQDVYQKNNKYKANIDPATKTFMALRIYVNQELDILSGSIEDCFSILDPGGILEVISFHSLEDRIVKIAFNHLKKNFSDDVSILTRKPIAPSNRECMRNKRARSAKLRILKKI